MDKIKEVIELTREINKLKIELRRKMNDIGVNDGSVVVVDGEVWMLHTTSSGHLRMCERLEVMHA